MPRRKAQKSAEKSKMLSKCYQIVIKKQTEGTAAMKRQYARFPRLLTQHVPGQKNRLFIIWPADLSGTGKRKKEYLGTESPETRALYLEMKQRFEKIAEETKKKTGAPRPRIDPRQEARVATLVDKYMAWAKEHYRKRGKPTGTDRAVWYTLKPFLIKYGGMRTAAFGLDQLEEWQQHLDRSGRLCRNQINARIRIICHAFDWGARHRTETGERLVPPAVASELRMIEKLKRGYCQAIDHPRKRSVPPADIEKTIPFLSRPVAAMVRLQLITGARPGEIRIMRAEEIHRTEADLWEYRPTAYKTEHFDGEGERKTIYLGPRAIELLAPIMADAEKRGGGYLFRPIDAAEDRRVESAKKKKTPSRAARDAERASRPGRRYGELYTATAYRDAVQRASERAGVPKWTPYQIRKTRATEIDRELGQDAAATVLGHRNVKTTLEHYIDPQTEKARELARRIG